MSNVITDSRDVPYTSVLLIDQDGQNLGLKSTVDAIEMSRKSNLDLAIVNDKGKIPVCRIMDVKKVEYKKKVAERKSKPKTIKLKEVRVNCAISENDLKTKTNSINKFLKKGHHVKVTIRSRERRELSENIQHMKEYLDVVLNLLEEDFRIDGKPSNTKNQYSIKIVPQ